MTKLETKANQLPRDAKTGLALNPMQQPGYYPGYSTLHQRKFWDAATRNEVEKRVYDIPPIRFFSDDELRIARAVCERIIPQEDRMEEFRIPIVNYIDERLFENKIAGYRYEDMPHDREAYRWGLQAIEQTAHALHGNSFALLDTLRQEHILKSIHDGQKLAAHDIWSRMSIDRFWYLLVQDCVEAYYAHPWAWDEIGYGGPAYPRAYTRLEKGLPEPWEEDEKRYEWMTPTDSISDEYTETGAGSETTHQGQGGTH